MQGRAEPLRIRLALANEREQPKLIKTASGVSPIYEGAPSVWSTGRGSGLRLGVLRAGI